MATQNYANVGGCFDANDWQDYEQVSLVPDVNFDELIVVENRIFISIND